LLAGVAVIVGNPKAMLFYLGILPGFFSVGSLSLLDTAAIVGISALIPLLGNLLFAVLIDRARAVLQTPAALARLNRIAGGLLIAVGVVIAW
jgi:threonine/homoserine/homoserine lactone efflux protein